MEERICHGRCLKQALISEADSLALDARTSQIIVGTVTERAEQNDQRANTLLRAVGIINRTGLCNGKSCGVRIQVSPTAS